MAQFSVNTHRFDPYRNFKFKIKWDNQYVAGLSKCSALKKTTEYILAEVYSQKAPLGTLWEELDRSEQLDIRIARQLVLHHIPFYLRQLGVHKHPRLQDFLNQWNEARYKREEYYKSHEKKEEYDGEAKSS